MPINVIGFKWGSSNERHKYDYGALENIPETDIGELDIDTTAEQGTVDGDLYRAIQSFSWQNSVINVTLKVKKLFTSIITQLKTNTTTLAGLGDASTKTVVNSLTRTTAGAVLDARQGKALQDGKIDKTSIVDNLTTNDATKVLSAKQGKVLQDRLSVATTEYLPTYVTNDYYSTTAVNRIRLFRTGPRSGVVRINLANDLAAIPSSDNSEHEIATFSGVSFERDIFVILPSQNAGTYASTLYLNCTSNKIVIANYSGVNIVKSTFFRIVMPVILNLDMGV